MHLDDHVVVVHKPSGLLVHRSNIDKYETEFLVQRLRDQIGQQVFPVHRLDKPTSGLMVLALNKDAARHLAEQFEQRQVSKVYMAIVRGYVEDQLINYPLKEEFDKMTDSLALQTKPPQDAVTELVTLGQIELPFPVARYQSGRFSIVKLFPKTGRKHQLRRHLSHLRHPIVGDSTHGDGKQNRYARAHMKLDRLGLIASELSFMHPTVNKMLSFKTQIDDDLQYAFDLFNHEGFITN